MQTQFFRPSHVFPVRTPNGALLRTVQSAINQLADMMAAEWVPKGLFGEIRLFNAKDQEVIRCAWAELLKAMAAIAEDPLATDTPLANLCIGDWLPKRLTTSPLCVRTLGEFQSFPDKDLLRSILDQAEAYGSPDYLHLRLFLED